MRVKSSAKVKDWVAAINDTGLRPPEGWCYPHRFGSFSPPRGLIEDGSQVQWFVDGQAAFDAIASSIEEAKSEVFLHCFFFLKKMNGVLSLIVGFPSVLPSLKSFLQIFIADWWLCPELYLRRPFHAHGTSRLDSLLEARAKQGVQVVFFAS